MVKPSLRLENLKLPYGCLKPLSKDIPFENITWIRGPNGIGKSTLLRTLSGLLPPHAGSIHSPKLAVYFGHQLGLLGTLTLRDHLNFWEKSTLFSNQKFWECPWLDHLPLDTPVDHLSYGDQKKAALVRLFSPLPGLYLLDEPFSGLDLKTKSALSDYFKNLKDSLLLLTSHEILPSHLYSQVWDLEEEGR